MDEDGEYELDENNQRIPAPGFARVENDTIVYCNYCNDMIDIPEGIVGISDGAFQYTGMAPYTGQIRGIDFPNSISEITQGDLIGSESRLTSIKFKAGNNPLTIGANAFVNGFSQALAKIEIPARTVTIGSGALGRLSSVTFEYGTEPLSIGAGAALNNTNLTRITIPRRVTSIGDDAFKGNTALRIVNFESGTSPLAIGKSAFADTTALTTMTLPSRLTSIGEDVFKDSGLNQVTFLGTAPTVDADDLNTASLSGTSPTAYVDTASASTFTPANPDWYGLTLSNGQGPAGPPPTISLISPDTSLKGSKSTSFADYQLEILASDPYTVAVTSGSLPPGLSVSSTGLISGTPTAGGSFNATIEVTDEYGSGNLSVPVDIFESPIPLQKISRVVNPRYFVNVGALTFFSAGSSLWVSDGSDTGTRVIGSDQSPIYYGANSITRVNGGVVFQSEDIETEESALYFSDGSNNEPVKIPAAVAPKYGNSMLTAIQNRLYYIDSSYKLIGIDLDGNTIPTPDLLSPYALTPVGGRLYYLDDISANLMFLNLSTNSIETVTVNTTSTEAFPKFDYLSNLTALNSGILFRAFDPVNEFAIWYLSENSSVPINLTSGVEYFELMPTGPSHARCQESICPFSVHEGHAYFFTGFALWKTNGFTSTLVKETVESDNDFRGIWYGENFYFTFNSDDGRGTELQKYNPSSNLITGITDIIPGNQGSNIRELGSSETALFFSAEDSSDIKNLWISGTGGLSLSDDATLDSGSIKGVSISNFGTPSNALANVLAGAISLSGSEARNIGATTSFITNAETATVTKIVKYSFGASTATFASADSYSNQAITDGDFFIAEVTAEDSSKKFYRINVTVTQQAIVRPTSGTTYRREIGSEISVQPELAYSEAGSFSVAAGSLPDGVEMDTSTGNISGTITSLGKFEATLRWTGSETGASVQSRLVYNVFPAGSIPDGLNLVASELYVGEGANSSGEMFSLNNKAFFSNYTLERGIQIWSTDGSETNTAEFYSNWYVNNLDVDPVDMVPWKNGFAFKGVDRESNNITIYFSDGTLAGTTPTNVHEYVSAYGAGGILGNLVSYNGLLYYRAGGEAIFSTDGTETNTVKVMDYLSLGEGDIANIAVLGNKIYFTFCGEGPPCTLWLLDPDSDPQVPTRLTGTGRVDSAGREILDANTLTRLGNSVIFSGSMEDPFQDGSFLYGIWRAGETSTENLLLTPGEATEGEFKNNGRSTCTAALRNTCTNQNIFTVWNNYAIGNDSNGFLWKTDGTPSGTRKIAATAPQMSRIGIVGDILDDFLYFSYQFSDDQWNQLWSIDLRDETAAPIQITNIFNLNPDNFTTLNGSLLFTGDVGNLWAYTPSARPAPPAPSPTASPQSNPIQQSKVLSISPASAVALNPSLVTVSGDFIEAIVNITIDGNSIPVGAWKQTRNEISFLMPSNKVGTYSIQLYNGSSPLLDPISFVFTLTPEVKVENSSTDSATKPESETSNDSGINTNLTGSEITKPLKNTFTTKIYFDLGSSAINSKNRKRLQSFAKRIAGLGAAIRISVTGFAQPTPGSRKTDLALSKKRAANVAALLRKFGVNTRVTYAGAGRALLNVPRSRYVEIVVVNR
jgi:outer membrane protein OmpA-like peptidoglycan-associated protein